jgi:hypothetical protein
VLGVGGEDVGGTGVEGTGVDATGVDELRKKCKQNSQQYYFFKKERLIYRYVCVDIAEVLKPGGAGVDTGRLRGCCTPSTNIFTLQVLHNF